MRVLNISILGSVKECISIMGIGFLTTIYFIIPMIASTFYLPMQHIRPVDYQCFINKMVEKSVLHFFFFAERVQN